MSIMELAQTGLDQQLPTPGTWTIDPSHSSIDAIARHLMFAKVRGTFSEFAGSFEVAERPEDTKVSVSIQAASIRTGDDRRDAHLRSPDFLDAETFPTIDFVSKTIVREDHGYKVIGELTIRGVARPVEIESAYLGVITDPYGNEKVVFSGRTELDREAFGITWNAPLESGGVLLGRKLAIELEVQAAKA